MMLQILDQKQFEIFQEISKGRNFFITGGAGTGKSYLLKLIKKHFENSGLHVTASTGIAAVQINGVTVHSWMGIGVGNNSKEQILQNINSARLSFLRKRLKKAKILAIDEISMISGKIFDLIDFILKNIRGNSLAFGGLQLIVLGDFLQLPPIFNELDEQKKFCFESEAWNEANFKVFMLNKTHRQEDKSFCDLLSRMRVAKLEDIDCDILRSRINIEDQNDVKPTIIVTHNKQVNMINERELDKLSSKEFIYDIEKKGDDKTISFLTKNCLAAEQLILKKNAQVMMIKNTYYKDNIINGSLGIIINFSVNNLPIVKFSCGTIKEISADEWSIEEYDIDSESVITKARIKQLPLMLSWAITVHKSQGMTLDKINCDLDQAFEEGQIYVAISRVKSLEGLYLKGFNRRSIRANQKIIEFYQKFENSSDLV